MITREQLEKKPAYPVGEYELEIQLVEHIAGMGSNGEPYQQAKIKTAIVTPENLAGKNYTLRLFYDNRLANIITKGLGKSLDLIFGKDDKADPEKIRAVLEGQFFRCRIGIDKNGYNNIAEVLEPEKSMEP